MSKNRKKKFVSEAVGNYLPSQKLSEFGWSGTNKEAPMSDGYGQPVESSFDESLAAVKFKFPPSNHMPERAQVTISEVNASSSDRLTGENFPVGEEPISSERWATDAASYDVNHQLSNAFNSTRPRKTMIGGSNRSWEPFSFETSTLQELEAQNVISPTRPSDLDDQRGAISIHTLPEYTQVVGLVIDKNDASNRSLAIPCGNGIAIGGYAHDTARDSYLVRCVDAVALGSVGFSLLMSVPGTGNWKTKVPICEEVLLRAFNTEQIKKLEEYRLRYPPENFRIEFMQMVSCK